MSTNIETLVIRQVYEGSNYLVVGPASDNHDWVELRSDRVGNSAGYFGEVSLCFPPEYAIQLGKALIAAGQGEAK